MRQENFISETFISTENDSHWEDPVVIKNAHTISQVNVKEEDCSAGGITILSNGRTAWVDHSDTHSIIFGSTGSMKTRRLVMPLLYFSAMAGESFIVTDPKGELYEKTSGFVAAKGYKKIIVLNFRDLLQSDCWNLLMNAHSMRHSGNIDRAISQLNDILSAIAEPHRKGAKDPYFSELSYQLAFALLLFFIETTSTEEANIYNFANLCATGSSPDSIERISNRIAKGSIAYTNFHGVLANKNAGNTFGNIVAGVSAFINTFIIQKSLCQVLSCSSFDIREIGNEKTAIYIVVPDEKTTLHFLVTAFVKQTYEALIHEAQQMPNKKLPVRVNFVLDEFANIPAIPDMPAMISAARARNMRFFLIAQGMRQLRGKYGEDAHTIKGNCDNWVFFTSREYDLLQEISTLCGNAISTYSDDKIRSKPLISISQLQRLKKECGEALILHGRHYPLVSKLPDIDEYQFAFYPPIKAKERQLPQIVQYDVEKVLEEIENKKRPIPFSVEVFGEERYYEKSVAKAVENSNLWDWS